MMETKNVEIKLPEGKFHTQLQFFDESDKKTIRNMYDNWVTLSDELQQYGGRRINLPEIISEAIFCLNFNAGKKTKSIGSANPYNIIRAAVDGLKQQKSPKMVANRRSKKVSAITSGRE